MCHMSLPSPRTGLLLDYTVLRILPCKPCNGAPRCPWPFLQVQRERLGRLRPLCYAWLSTAFLAAGHVVLPRSELDKVRCSGLHT